MGYLASAMQLDSHFFASSFTMLPSCVSNNVRPSSLYSSLDREASGHIGFPRRWEITAVSTVSEGQPAPEPPLVDFAFVHSVLLPDGSPDVHCRRSSGGQKLRDVMLNGNLELYGPDSRPLLNCAGTGACGTCMVEVIVGKEMLNPRTNNEKKLLKRKPKNYRLACQTTVGVPESTGMVVIQQLPEWKAHEWTYEKEPVPEPEP